jgi:hypothetical protein
MARMVTGIAGLPQKKNRRLGRAWRGWQAGKRLSIGEPSIRVAVIEQSERVYGKSEGR